MIFKRVCFFLFCCLNTFKSQSFAQTKHEVGLISDNDLYVSLYLDRFYTNGIQFFYKQVATTNYVSFDKKIRKFSLEQDMYNPQSSNEPIVRFQERPYAGYLYANYQEQFINSKNTFTLGVTLGVTGDKAKAEWAQDFIHQFYDIKPSDGWRTQVKQKVSVGLLAKYTRSLYYHKNSPVDFSWINNMKLNTIITNISSGVAMRLNFLKTPLNTIDNSSFYGTALQRTGETWIKENYLGFRSFMTYQIQDYTVTGELQKNPTQKQFNLRPWVWQNDFGIYWNLKHMNISYHQIFMTKNVSQINTKWIRYGSIQLSYKF